MARTDCVDHMDRSALAVPGSHVTGLIAIIAAMLQVGGAIVVVVGVAVTGVPWLPAGAAVAGWPAASAGTGVGVALAGVVLGGVPTPTGVPWLTAGGTASAVVPGAVPGIIGVP